MNLAILTVKTIVEAVFGAHFGADLGALKNEPNLDVYEAIP